MLSLALTAEDRTYNQVIMRGWRSPARRYPINGQRNLTPETNMIEKLSYTVNEAAAAAGISRTKLYELINRSEEHTSELQSLMRTSYAVFCLNKKKDKEQAKVCPHG